MLQKTKATAKKKLEDQLNLIDALVGTKRGSPEFKRWRRDTEVIIQWIFGEDTRHTTDFKNIRYSVGAFSSRTPESTFQRQYATGLENAKAILESLIHEIDEFWDDEDPSLEIKPLDRLTRLCRRFHIVARTLQNRYSSRSTIEIRDEYDVQDLLHALLRIDFDDVRPEEWTPSYAGGTSRMDFLLKNEKIVVEVKKSRSNHGAKKIGEELLIDIVKYQAHQDCGLLFCFVYDPEGFITNPRGLEGDLAKSSTSLKVVPMIAPIIE